jgi:hypothetical protein
LYWLDGREIAKMHSLYILRLSIYVYFEYTVALNALLIAMAVLAAADKMSRV